MGRGMRGRVEALGEIGALSLSASDLTPASSSCSLGILAKRLMQRLRQVMQDPGAIIRDRDLNVILFNRLADLLVMKLLEL